LKQNRLPWYNDCDSKEQERDVDAIILAARPFVNLLKARLKDKAEASISTALSKTNYNKLNWAHKQADTIGYLRALKEIENLITTKE
jgi:hypothetical protein